MDFFVGRENESRIFKTALKSAEPELIAVYGRRRVGKTYMIKAFCEKHLIFSLTGINDGKLEEQLSKFAFELQKAMKISSALAPPKNWLQAFHMLQEYADSLPTNKTKVIFFDEIPWLDSHKSGFLRAFDSFWNSWATNHSKIKVVICGSAATWMINKIVNSKGGLHNRITRSLRLKPFNLQETEEFLRAKKVKLDRYSILQLYMVMGGIPHYLKEIQNGLSAAQNIDHICFSNNGLLKQEFQNLYSALFDNPGRHLSVINVLANHRNGLRRNQILEHSKLSSGGTFSSILEELEQSDFISKFVPYGKKEKDAIYRLKDQYTLFYLKYISKQKNYSKGYWLQKAESQSWVSWAGFAFEGLCLDHVDQIKQALGISGIYSEAYSWQDYSGDTGAQIDLLIDRNDRVINICEMKFSRNEFNITKRYNQELINKINVLRNATKTKKTIFMTFITTYGLKENKYSNSLVNHNLTMDILFKADRN